MATDRTVHSTWHGGYQCEITAGRFELAADEPTSAGGTDTGPQPTELFLASIASCFTLAVAHSAAKRSIELRDLAVTVTGTYDGPRFSAIRIDATLGCEPTEIDRLLEAAERVCFVTNTLRSSPELLVSARPSGG